MSGTDGPGLGLEVTAGLLGAYCALERALFELTGAAVAAPEADPEATVLLSAWSAEHAWHAELWADRLPVSAAFDSDALVVLAEPLPGLLDELARAGSLPLLSGLIRVVLPRLVITYERHLTAASAASDGPVRRALTLVLRDERDQWTVGEALLQGVLVDQAAVAAAGETVVGLERRLVAAGVGAGILPWPGPRA